MRIIALKTLRLFWEQHPDAQQALQAWYRDAKRATWQTPADIKNVYRNASIVGTNRVVFNIRGNQYRLVVVVQLSGGHPIHSLYWNAPGLRHDRRCHDLRGQRYGHPAYSHRSRI